VAAKPYFPTARDLPSSYAQYAVDGLLNLIYPENCYICSAPLVRQRDCGVCANCWGKAVALEIVRPWCQSCGLPFYNIDDDSKHICGNCVLQPPPYTGARSFGYYTAELRRLIQGLKFHKKQNLAWPLSSLLTTAFYESWSRKGFDLVLPVPLHPKRRREREYNQAELLARLLARQLAIPFSKSALRRIRSTSSQIGLTIAQRRENVRDAFRCKDPGQIAHRRVLLIDDVMTTGATAASAVQALLNGGALRVSVLTIARADFRF
jgi:ComF family protein